MLMTTVFPKNLFRPSSFINLIFIMRITHTHIYTRIQKHCQLHYLSWRVNARANPRFTDCSARPRRLLSRSRAARLAEPRFSEAEKKMLRRRRRDRATTRRAAEKGQSLASFFFQLLLYMYIHTHTAFADSLMRCSRETDDIIRGARDN